VTTSFVIISKDEATLDETLVLLEDQIKSLPTDAEIVVVDASSGRMDAIRRAHATVVWIDFQAPEGVTVSIPHPRNASRTRRHRGLHRLRLPARAHLGT
jgi:histidinol dehydrogenase